MSDPVVITGSGLVCSLGQSVSGVWEALTSGQSGIRPAGDAMGETSFCTHAARVSEVDSMAIGLHPRDTRITGKHANMLLKAASDAYANARITKAGVQPEEIGFFAGMGMIDYSVDDLLPAVRRSLAEDGSIDYDLFYDTGYQEINPQWPLAMLNNIVFCQVAIALSIKGENTVFCPHADSGSLAVASGAHDVLAKRARVVLAGGAGEVVSAMSLARASLSGLLHSDGDIDPALIRPFGSDKRSAVLGEGCAVLSLELASSAEKRKVSFSTMITGYGASCDSDAGAQCPTVRGISLSMHKALRSAGIGSGDIDLVIAHGDGTLQGEGNEAAAIREVFSDHKGSIVVYTSKPALGHTLAASPVVDVVLGQCMIEQGIVPPGSVSYTRNNIFQTFPAEVGAWDFKPRRIMINALSSEGQSSSLIIEASR